MAVDLTQFPGLSELWEETQGDPAITIALLDGPVDLGHPCFLGAMLTTLPSLVTDRAGDGFMSAHGTHVASMIFGRPSGGVTGIAPGCRGLIVPIYADEEKGPTSQLDLARAINQAVEAGAHVINVSGGELTSNGQADPSLVNAVRNCKDQGVLLVAAAGNDRCRCLHVPAAIPTVLAVGAADAEGQPLDSSNWGDAYQSQGILAPGLEMVGAAPGGGLALKSGTSFATPLVTGVVGLLLSLQLKRGQLPNPHAVREAILRSAIPCEGGLFTDCQHYLVGRLNIRGARALISQTPLGVTTMLDERTSEDRIQPSDAVASDLAPAKQAPGPAVASVAPSGLAEGHEGNSLCNPAKQPPGAGVLASRTGAPTATDGVRSAGGAAGWGSRAGTMPSAARAAGVVASEGCSCRDSNTPRSPIFAIGVLGYDFGTEARRDTFKSLMPNVYPSGIPYLGEPGVVSYPPNPYDPRQLVNYLAGYPRPKVPFPASGGFPKLSPGPGAPPAFPPEEPSVPPNYPGLEASPWDAAELIWTLNIELTPIYAIRPVGGFSAEAYRKLIEFLDGQNRNPDDNEYVERVSLPGYLSGETVCLFSGQVVPVLVPNVRGMYGWNTTSLINTVVSTVTESARTRVEREGAGADADAEMRKAEDNTRESLRNFLDRIYFDLRNLGQTPSERAMNFSATNAFQAAIVFQEPASRGMQLDTILVDRSPFCRKDSDCWEVKLRFFDPNNVLRARRVSRFTVDVSDVYPVLVGPIRTWSEAG